MARLWAGKYLNDFHVHKTEAQHVDHHGEYDQWQSPGPVRPPSSRRRRLETENGLGNCHQDFSHSGPIGTEQLHFLLLRRLLFHLFKLLF
jgi:hypothetical protein